MTPKDLPMKFFRAESPSPAALDAIKRALADLKETVPTHGNTSGFLLFDSQPDAPGAYVTPYAERGDVQYDMETIMEDYEAPFFVEASRNTVSIQRSDFSFNGQAEEVRRLELIAFKWVD